MSGITPTVITEREKYELVWGQVDRYGKDWMNPGLAGSIKRWITAAIPKGATVMDFGCGNGSSLAWLASSGYEPSGVEIARNATVRTDVIIGDLRKIPALPESSFGLCTDLMEHIPTADVDRVLQLISATVVSRCLFVIARDQDKDGAAIGQELHLTRKPREWWDEHILKWFKSVELLHYEPSAESAYCLWASH